VCQHPTTQGALASLAENSLVPYPLPNPTESKKKEAWPNIAESVQRARHVCLKLPVDTFEATSRYPPYTCPHTCSHTQTCICACVKFRMGLSEQFRMSAKVIKCARAVRPLSLRFAREVCFSWRLLSFVFYLLLGLFVARTLPVTLHTVCVRHYTLYLSQPHPSAPVRESYTL